MKESLLDVIEDFNNKYKDLESKLPYSFNLLDEVKAKENAHSKVLRKLIAYKEGDEYTFLKSFLESVDFGALSLKIKNPEIYAEKDRIDISIKDDDYAIIIENKIHNAPEQEEQVDGYVDTMRKYGYTYEQIYVLYLTRSGGNPSKYSLSKEVKDKLGNNYKAINYRDTILPWLSWLRDHVLPVCNNRHPLLISGIEQYIDHLEGIFKLRKNMKELNEQLVKELKGKLDLIKEVSPQTKVNEIKKIEEIEDGIKTFLIYLEKTKVKYRSEISNGEFNTKYKSNWQNSLNELSPEYKISWDSDLKGYCWIGIEMKYNDSRFLCGIGYDNISEQQQQNLKPYFGITCRPDTNINNQKNKKLKEFIQKEKEFQIEKSDHTTNWYVQKRTNFEDLIKEFEKYFNKVQSHSEVTIK